MSATSEDTTVISKSSFVPGGRTVAAERGWAWIADGWKIFQRAPGLWIGMIVVFAVIFIVLGIIPILGAVATMVLQPVLGAGLVIAAAKIDRGEAPRFSDLFAGFQTQFGKLATIGAIYLAAMAVIVVAAMLATGMGVASFAHSGTASPAAGAALLLAALIIMALMVPVMMAGWFAVPLALFQEQSAVDALKGSFAGCLKNLVPFLAYGVISVLLAIAACLPAMLGWLVLGPVLAASVYTGYKDIYLG